VFVDREFLQRLALDTRNDARNKPTRLKQRTTLAAGIFEPMPA
jgi:hypothetical protein